MKKMKKKDYLFREEYVTTLKKLLDYSVAHYYDMGASELLGTSRQYSFGEFGAQCEALIRKMDELGIKAGEHVALFSQNMPEWAMAFMAVTSSGRVIVPILAESSEVEVKNILEHSESTAIFVSESKRPKVDAACIEKMKLIIRLDDFSIEKEEATAERVTEITEPQPDDLAGIFYTSGTTGNAKGVMLSHRNICQNLIAAWYTQPCPPGWRWLSILPAAHTYELAFSLLYPIFAGGCVSYLQKAPTSTVLIQAMAKVKPHIICSVPLIIEKVYRNSVRKTIDKSRVLLWLENNFTSFTYRLIGGRIKKTFGGCLRFFGIGGAKLDPVVEAFLKKAGFPYAIGYGLTETAPLICNTTVGTGRVGSIGKASHNVQVRLGDINPETGEGEIQCKGPNVMLGYYKDPERTASVFTPDGWFKTGDLATCSANGYYSIRGRIGSMIVGPSGENIYPEEIENVINQYEGVGESLVVNRDGKLVALVKFDESVINFNTEKMDQLLETIEEKKKAIMDYVNNQVRKSNNINEVEIMKTPFVKTATLKIRRFLYQKKNTTK